MVIFFHFPQVILDSLHTLLTQLHFLSLSRSKNKTTLLREPQKLNLQNRQKPKQNRIHTKTKESVLCWPLSPLNVVDIPRITALERTDIFLSLLVSVANRFLVRNETLCFFSILFHAGISFGLYLWESYRCKNSLIGWVHITSVLFRLENTVSLEMFTTFSFYNLFAPSLIYFPEPWWEGFD